MQAPSEEIIDTATVSEKGQVAIPAEIRNKLGITKGDKLIFVLVDGKLLVMPARRLLKENTKDEFAYLLKLSESSAKDLWDNETDDRVWNSI